MAGPTGFEPAISSVTGRRDRPLHYEPLPIGTQILNATGVIIATHGSKSNWLDFDIAVRRVFGLERLDVGRDVFEGKLNVRGVTASRAGVDEFDDVEGVAGVDDS